MFHLIYGLWKMIFRKDEYRVLVIGLHNAGKTTILEAVKGMHGTEPLPAHKICPTVGLNIGRIELKACRLLMWDLGGQRSLRPIWNRFITQAHAVVFVIDASIPPGDESWDELRQTMLHNLAAPSLSDVPVLLLANKTDLPTAMSPQDIMSLLTQQSSLSEYFASHPAYKILPCSGLTGESLSEGLNWMVSYLMMTEGQRMFN